MADYSNEKKEIMINDPVKVRFQNDSCYIRVDYRMPDAPAEGFRNKLKAAGYRWDNHYWVKKIGETEGKAQLVANEFDKAGIKYAGVEIQQGIDGDPIDLRDTIYFNISDFDEGFKIIEEKSSKEISRAAASQEQQAAKAEPQTEQVRQAAEAEQPTNREVKEVEIEEDIKFDDIVYSGGYSSEQSQELLQGEDAYKAYDFTLDSNVKMENNLFRIIQSQQEETKAEPKAPKVGNRHTEITHDENAKAILDENAKAVYVFQTDVNQKQQTAKAEPKAEKSITEDDEDSFIKRLQAIADVDERACNELGVYNYLNKNIDQAVEYFQKASDMGYTVAKRNLAIALESNNSEQAEHIFNLYKEAAENGDVISLNNLGCCYLSGDGTEEDIKKAVKCFEAASSKGDILAKINLADCYSIGNGVRKNPNKAYKLYKEAAELGNPVALKRVAECYLNGEGVSQNFKNALDCYHKAALKGDDEAKHLYDKLAEKAAPTKHQSMDERIAEAKAKAETHNAEIDKNKEAQAPNKQREKNEPSI